MSPKVSVIVPCFDAEKTLGPCLDSLKAIRYPAERLEVIIVDNGSTDGTRALLAEYPFRALVETRRGSYAARNAGVKEAAGDVLAFTDSDCVVDPDWISEAVKALEDPAVGGVAGEVRPLEPQSLVEEFQARQSAVSQSTTFGHPYLPYALTANAVYRRSVFDKIGDFEASWVSGGDADFSWRMQVEAKKKLVYSRTAVVYHHHRSTPESLFAQCKKNIQGACLLNKKYKGKFEYVAEPSTPREIDVKIFANRMKAARALLGWRLTHEKKLYFEYLRRVSRIGYLHGYREMLGAA